MASIEEAYMDANKKQRIISETGDTEYNSNESDVDVEHVYHHDIPSNSFDFAPTLHCVHSENPAYGNTPLNCRDTNNKFCAFAEVIEIFENKTEVQRRSRQRRRGVARKMFGAETRE